MVLVHSTLPSEIDTLQNYLEALFKRPGHHGGTLVFAGFSFEYDIQTDQQKFSFLITPVLSSSRCGSTFVVKYNGFPCRITLDCGKARIILAENTEEIFRETSLRVWSCKALFTNIGRCVYCFQDCVIGDCGMTRDQLRVLMT